MWFQVDEPADPAHVAAVVALARSARPRCGTTRVIAIDGPAGSGKTTLAQGVCAALHCAAVHMDHIVPGWDGLAEAVDLLTGQVLGPLSRGVEASYRVWDWERGRWGESRTVAPAAFLVVEGCGSSVGSAGGYAAVRVFVEAGHDERMRRGLARDGDTFAPHWERWARQEAALFGADRTREQADLVLRTDS